MSLDLRRGFWAAIGAFLALLAAIGLLLGAAYAPAPDPAADPSSNPAATGTDPAATTGDPAATTTTTTDPPDGSPDGSEEAQTLRQSSEPGGGDVRMKVTAKGDPIEVMRALLHRTSADVPAFPLPDRRLVEPSGWPKTLTLKGVKLQRQMHAWDGPIGRPIESLKEVKSGWRLVLSYARVGESVSAGWGPRFTWDKKGKLVERIWYEPEPTRLITHDYTYYPDGTLLGYSWRNGPRSQSDSDETEYFSEFFDQSGKLLAVGYERNVGGKKVSAYEWNGRAVPFDDFRMRSHVLYARAR